ncbi:sulfite oxidase-like [Lineus longissimus]|uniref:sulfite oxidase-like n=1 Tax=Lineus longissimus TaxID=88925 RepID=UPI00315CBF95
MHPGGTKVLLAAGGALEPFWSMYPVHKESSVIHWLEKYRIGEMAPDEAKHVDTSDPFAGDPERHPALQVNSARPFNAETPLELLTDNFVTPNELFFVRNHLPVPNVDAKNYKLTVSGLGVKTMEFSLNDLKKKFKKHTVKATMECAGNRRAEMTEIKEVKGLMWKGTAISNAEWSGVLLRDVLKSCGFNVDDPNVSHVQFEGYDKDPAAGGHYGASVPSELALNPQGDVLLAYEMNGEDLPVDHGFPVRVVIPGTVGARNVKWLSQIVTSNEESKSHWQQNDYKGFNPSVDWDTIDYKNAIPINEAPVTSAICVPQPGKTLDDDEEVSVKGYAWSGGGRGIIRVDLSLDGGKTWQVASLQKDESRYNRHWSWTLWEADLKIPKNHQGKVEIICKATDSSYNTQPDSVAGIWNVRGLLNNAWHKVVAKVPDSEETKPFGTPEIQSVFSAGWPHYMFQANFF